MHFSNLFPSTFLDYKSFPMKTVEKQNPRAYFDLFILKLQFIFDFFYSKCKLNMASSKQSVKGCWANKFHNYCNFFIVYIWKLSLFLYEHHPIILRRQDDAKH